MSRIDQKRTKSTAIPKPCRKRRKLEATQNEPTRTKPSVATLSADELAWKEVTPPERLDDAEGFFGLEEIDDVEVVREANGERLYFRSSSRPSPSRPYEAPLRDRVSGKSVKNLQDNEEWEEWSGFTDDRELGFNTPEEDGRQRYSEDIHSNQTDKSNLGFGELPSGNPYSILDNRSEEDLVDISEWSSLTGSDKVLCAIAGLGFTRPTPIQTAVIPQVLAGHDVIGKAVTGSGKTLAFAIPIFENWLASNGSGHSPNFPKKTSPHSLILTPTRELAHQLSKHFENLVEHAEYQPRIVTITGGLSIQKQQRQLVNADIIIGTPGRLWEVMYGSQDMMDGLKRIQFLVLDEADRLLSEGHFKEVEELLDMLDRHTVEDKEVVVPKGSNFKKPSRQTLVFSATFHQDLQRKLASRSRFNEGEPVTNKQSIEYLLQKISFREMRPKFVDVNPTSQMAQQLKEGLVECSAMEKDIYLYSILIQRPKAKILVFTNSISSVRRLMPILQNLNLPASALHSSMAQKARLRSVERFSEPKTGGSVLVATDVAARGLDIQNIDLILHYHVPRTADSYIHRSGRTARATSAGESILLCSPDEVAGVTKLVAQVHQAAGGHRLEPIYVERQLVARLLPRLTLSQKITGATLAKAKVGSQDGWLRTAAEEIGVDFDSDDFAAAGAKNSRGRGSMKRQQQKLAGAVPKAEVSNWRSQLKDLLSKHINLGVNERYLTGGSADMNALLDAREKFHFLNSRMAGD